MLPSGPRDPNQIDSRRRGSTHVVSAVPEDLVAAGREVGVADAAGAAARDVMDARPDRPVRTKGEVDEGMRRSRTRAHVQTGQLHGRATVPDVGSTLALHGQNPETGLTVLLKSKSTLGTVVIRTSRLNGGRTVRDEVRAPSKIRPAGGISLLGDRAPRFPSAAQGFTR